MTKVVIDVSVSLAGRLRQISSLDAADASHQPFAVLT
jgi:hypothetical protein